MKIDTHQHVFWRGKDDAGLVQDMDQHGVDLAWLLTWEIAPSEDAKQYTNVLNPLHQRADGTHAGILLHDILIACDRFPKRFVAGYCPHPAIGDAAGLFEAAHQMHGVRVCGEWKFRMLFDDPRCIRLFRKAGELQAPVVLHLDIPFIADGKGGTKYEPDWYGGTVENLERALIACPETTFIGHAPGFWREISGDAATDPAPYPQGPITPGGKLHRLFDTYPNLYADLSAGSGRRALARDPEHARRFIDRYQDRLLYGRDTYGRELDETLQSLELPAAALAKIHRDNAQRLMRRWTPSA
jgi:predicted TIM-barrel fold metal-dependent hydrolase